MSDKGVNTDSLFVSANDKLGRSDFQGALEEMNKAIMLKPDAETYSFRGAIRTAIEDFKGAIEDLTIAVTKRPIAEAYSFRGIAKMGLGDVKGAIEDYSTAISLNSDDSRGYYLRGSAKVNIDDYAGAIEDFTQAINRDPEDAETYFSRAVILLKTGNKREARVDFLKTRALGKDVPDDVLALCTS